MTINERAAKRRQQEVGRYDPDYVLAQAEAPSNMLAADFFMALRNAIRQRNRAMKALNGLTLLHDDAVFIHGSDDEKRVSDALEAAHLTIGEVPTT